MSYVKAEDVLPEELIEMIQQYVSGKNVYIPSKEKKDWGSQTKTKDYYKIRNLEISTKYGQGCSVSELANEYSLSVKSIQRIINSVKEKNNDEDILSHTYCTRRETMSEYNYIKLEDNPAMKEKAAEWFSSKWGVPKEAYLECMNEFLNGETPYGWYLCLHNDKIVAGLGVIENDFHDRKDLSPNVCAVYTEEEYRCKGIAGKLLDIVVEDMKNKGVSPLYLVTDHVGFYERYGWEFLCMAQGDDEPEMTRMYIHR